MYSYYCNTILKSVSDFKRSYNFTICAVSCGKHFDFVDEMF